MNLLGLIIYSKVNGTLDGVWMNNVVLSFQQEIILNPNGNQGFVGVFISQWDDSSGAFIANLNITRISDDQFSLTWTNLQDRNSNQAIDTTYDGIGTIINNQLVCSYRLLN